MTAETIRVRGLVQGVGFRPSVWRLARECGLKGDVRNDGEGVLIRAWADADSIARFCQRLREDCPPLARIDTLERAPLAEDTPPPGFEIIASHQGRVRTGVVPDAATCPACLAEIRDPANRRYRYPFTNCTHCGPRLSILRGIPYDRANTSMSVFPLCADCAAEYTDPADRRFHAQPNACPVCGPQLWLQDRQGRRIDDPERDAIELAAALLADGRIIAIKGIGGFHLACDAADETAVAELRRRKRRFHKPFALMARDPQVIRRYAQLDAEGEALLAGPAAPILLCDRLADAPLLAADIAPGQSSLGFMLPYSPLHHLLLADWDRPLVMTSGNLSDEPQCIDNGDADGRLGDIADLFLLHDRAIVNRVDDSVLRPMAGAPRFLRRARGFAPAPIPLPPGFSEAPPLIGLGAELKNTLCLLREGQAILSQHLGDLEHARTAEEFERSIALYLDIFQHRPVALVIDAHPDYRSSRLGRAWSKREGLPLLEVQHHHAHIASVMADNGLPLDAGPVLGIALDGLGYGEDGSIWGGEFLRADYAGFRRLARLRPVAMPGGVKAILEPWRNTYAQIHALFGWEDFRERWPELDITRWLQVQPLPMLEAMLDKGLNSPQSSSCGRLFDAVAAALGVCREQVSYEGQAAIELEALAAGADGQAPQYAFGEMRADDGLWQLDPRPLWEGLFDDLQRGTPAARIAAGFHHALADAVVSMAAHLAEEEGLERVALSGGVFQNRTLLEAVNAELEARGLQTLLQRQVPSNDGGLSLGQVAVAAASLMAGAGPGD